MFTPAELTDIVAFANQFLEFVTFQESFMLSSQLKSQIRQLWDAFWSGGIANPLTAIEQITYLVFLKRLSDLDDERAKNAIQTGQSYSSLFEG